MAIIFTESEVFNPPNAEDTPEALFQEATTLPGGRSRFLSSSNARQMLISTGGSCVNSGRFNAAGGCAFHFKGDLDPYPLALNASGVVSFSLENRGPSGIVHAHTINRAELRAVIGALQYLPWNSESLSELVIATDSHYVVEGATQKVVKWVRNNWRKASGTEVKNKDLWIFLLTEIRNLQMHLVNSIQVLFWKIPRALNAVAKEAAKEAAETQGPTDNFAQILGGPQD